MNLTYFGLLATLGESEVPLAKVCQRFFSLDEREACRRAALGTLPVKAYRCGSQKSPWLVSVADLADLIEKRKARARFLADAA